MFTLQSRMDRCSTYGMETAISLKLNHIFDTPVLELAELFSGSFAIRNIVALLEKLVRPKERS